jgi:hypothetical protein
MKLMDPFTLFLVVFLLFTGGYIAKAFQEKTEENRTVEVTDQGDVIDLTVGTEAMAGTIITTFEGWRCESNPSGDISHCYTSGEEHRIRINRRKCGTGVKDIPSVCCKYKEGSDKWDQLRPALKDHCRQYFE